MNPTVTMYTTSWCPDCHATKNVLKQRGIEFMEVDIEQNEDAAQHVMAINGGKRSVPTLEYNGQAASMSRFSREKLDAWLVDVGLR